VPLADAYDAIVAMAANPEHADRVARMRKVFEERTGQFGTLDFEARTRAFWDDALTRQGFARQVAPDLPQGVAAWVPGLTRAHRGLFRVEEVSGRQVLVDVWAGARFFVDEIDPASRDAVDAAAAPFDARLAARADGPVVALLPGSICHPAEAGAAMQDVLEVARGRALGTDEVLDALLRMELSLRTLSRVKPAYAYRPEALPPAGRRAV
jgi:hypothetical protein